MALSPCAAAEFGVQKAMTMARSSGTMALIGLSPLFVILVVIVVVAAAVVCIVLFIAGAISVGLASNEFEWTRTRQRM
jgi:hypothetical protein